MKFRQKKRSGTETVPDLKLQTVDSNRQLVFQDPASHEDLLHGSLIRAAEEIRRGLDERVRAVFEHRLRREVEVRLEDQAVSLFLAESFVDLPEAGAPDLAVRVDFVLDVSRILLRAVEPAQ